MSDPLRVSISLVVEFLPYMSSSHSFAPFRFFLLVRDQTISHIPELHNGILGVSTITYVSFSRIMLFFHDPNAAALQWRQGRTDS